MILTAAEYASAAATLPSTGLDLVGPVVFAVSSALLGWILYKVGNTT